MVQHPASPGDITIIRSLTPCDEKAFSLPNQLEFHKRVYSRKHHNFIFNHFTLIKEKSSGWCKEKKTQTQKKWKENYLKNVLRTGVGAHCCSTVIIFSSLFLPLTYSFNSLCFPNPSERKNEMKNNAIWKLKDAETYYELNFVIYARSFPFRSFFFGIENFFTATTKMFSFNFFERKKNRGSCEKEHFSHALKFNKNN